MRLLKRSNDGTLSLTNHIPSRIPEYAILSHTWFADEQEVNFADIINDSGREKRGWQKIVFCGEQAASDGLEYFWIDSCCIDKSSSAELTESINSMFRWYKNAARCYVYLSDVSTSSGLDGAWKPSFRSSRWFKRGWTLQELLAPRAVRFFSKDGAFLGDKRSLLQDINETTGIHDEALHGALLSQFSVEERMKWAEGRQTTIPEDRIYSLLGVFNISMPLIYGEGYDNALRRLQKEINDDNGARSGRSKKLSTERKEELVESLRFDHIEDRENTIKAAHVNTCNWLLSSPQYRAWQDPNKFTVHNGLLWIKGKPGAGKSTLMKFMSDRIRLNRRDAVCLAFFFNARGSKLEKDTRGLYQSLLFQLLTLCPDLQEIFDEVNRFMLPRSGMSSWKPEILKQLLVLALTKFDQGQLFIFADALDECDEDQVREMLGVFEDVGSAVVESQIPPLMCFSSRHYPRITVPKLSELILENESQHARDIELYIGSQLRAGKSYAISQIHAEILRRAAGVFIWVVIVVKMLNKAYDQGHIHALRKKLDEIPDDLSDLFHSILTRDQQNMDSMRACIGFVLLANRPLTKEELFFAIVSVTDPGQLDLPDLGHIDDYAMDSFLLSASKGLTELTLSASPTVQFIHESVRDFLSSDQGLPFLWPLDQRSPFALIHEQFKQSCLNYINSAARHTADSNRIKPQMFPFLGYALGNLFYHAEMAAQGGSSQHNFLSDLSIEDYILLSNTRAGRRGVGTSRFTPDSTLLYVLAEYDCGELVRTWLKLDGRIDPPGGRHMSPLRVACVVQSEDAIQALLAPPFNHNRDPVGFEKFQAPSLEEVRAMIAFYNYKRSSAQDEYSLPWFFLRNGRELPSLGILRSGHFALGRKDRSTARDALSYAAEAGHIQVVQFLLEARERGCWDLPSKHTLAGHLHSISSSDIDIDARSALTRQTALSYASSGGHSDIIRLLLQQRGVDVNSADALGKTPLFHAACQGKEAAVRVLLSDPNIDINRVDSTGQTPLACVCALGLERIAKLLLEHREIDINAKDSLGRTALVRAIEGEPKNTSYPYDMNRFDLDNHNNNRAHLPIIKLLLSLENVEVDSSDNSGRSPIFSAARKGNSQVLDMLLSTGVVDINKHDHNYQSLLHYAVINRRPTIVRRLLELQKWDIHGIDVPRGRSVLSYAGMENLELIEMLVEHCGCFSCLQAYHRGGVASGDRRLWIADPDGPCIAATINHGQSPESDMYLSERTRSQQEQRIIEQMPWVWTQKYPRL